MFLDYVTTVLATLREGSDSGSWSRSTVQVSCKTRSSGIGQESNYFQLDDRDSRPTSSPQFPGSACGPQVPVDCRRSRTRNFPPMHVDYNQQWDQCPWSGARQLVHNYVLTSCQLRETEDQGLQLVQKSILTTCQLLAQGFDPPRWPALLSPWRQVEIIWKYLKLPPSSPLGKASDLANHINLGSHSALSPIWTPPINESAELTRWPSCYYSEAVRRRSRDSSWSRCVNVDYTCQLWDQCPGPAADVDYTCQLWDQCPGPAAAPGPPAEISACLPAPSEALCCPYSFKIPKILHNQKIR